MRRALAPLVALAVLGIVNVSSAALPVPITAPLEVSAANQIWGPPAIEKDHLLIPWTADEAFAVRRLDPLTRERTAALFGDIGQQDFMEMSAPPQAWASESISIFGTLTDHGCIWVDFTDGCPRAGGGALYGGAPAPAESAPTLTSCPAVAPRYGDVDNWRSITAEGVTCEEEKNAGVKVIVRDFSTSPVTATEIARYDDLRAVRSVAINGDHAAVALRSGAIEKFASGTRVAVLKAPRVEGVDIDSRGAIIASQRKPFKPKDPGCPRRFGLVIFATSNKKAAQRETLCHPQVSNDDGTLTFVAMRGGVQSLTQRKEGSSRVTRFGTYRRDRIFGFATRDGLLAYSYSHCRGAAVALRTTMQPSRENWAKRCALQLLTKSAKVNKSGKFTARFLCTGGCDETVIVSDLDAEFQDSVEVKARQRAVVTVAIKLPSTVLKQLKKDGKRNIEFSLQWSNMDAENPWEWKMGLRR